VSLPAISKRGLTAIAVGLAVPAGAPASSQPPPRFTPAQVHLVAEEASVVRGLLRIEDSLTYDAVAVRPSRRALARRIRVQNQLLIRLCNAIIRDDARISAAERKLRRAHAARMGFDTAELFEAVKQATADVRAKLETLKQKGDQISIADMFEMQLLMNHLSQLSEMATSVVSSSNSAIASMARNVKS
jgi:hypothetical protein